MAPLCDIACDWNVIGLVGQNEPSDFTLAHDAAQGFRIGRVGAGDPMMRPQLKDVAEPRDWPCGWLRRERPVL
jgi:hypothetical protein